MFVIHVKSLSDKEKMVGTAGFFGALFACNSTEPATDGYLQTTTEAVAHYSPLLCQISQEPSKRRLLELRPESDCFFLNLVKRIADW